MKRLGLLVFCVLLFCVLISTGAAEREIPHALKATQTIEIRHLENFRIITCSRLYTVRQDVNKAINDRVAALEQETEPLVPRGYDNKNRPARGDICTQITRTGDRWMSFHIVAQTSVDNNQLWVKSEEYTYNMETGRMIRLGEIIREEGWEPLLREVRTQLVNLFPRDEPDENALDAICRRESLTDAGFVMTPGHLALYFPAADVYPAHKEALLRVEIYVPELWEILTEEARKETDCTGYALVALTYDDGPGKGRTRDVLNQSACHPGQVTFFVIGYRIEKNAELVHKEFDAGHSVQSHSWKHSVEPADLQPEKVASEQAQYSRTMGNLIGAVPIMMRPPGGRWKLYRAAGVEEPLILWSVNSQDASTNASEEELDHYYACALSAKDGDIVLHHDMKLFAGKLAERVMDRLEEKNMLMVTVNDLCALRGVKLEAGLNLNSCPREEGE